jgi:serine/threonine-protein kinase
MGIVYDVRHDETGEQFALKTIETRFLKLPETNAGRRFTQEIEILEKLDDPGIVHLHDCGFVRHPMGYELAFFVMERLTGETLGERVADGRLMDAKDAVKLAADVTRALVYLTEHGILHRDIKPGNLFLEESGRVVLMDFGLARSREFTRLTKAGHVIGTLAYMSPEALVGDDIDGRTDVFALGVVLFEALAGMVPFTARDPSEHVKEIAAGPRWPTPLPDDPMVHETCGLIEAMLAPDKERRPTAVEVEQQARYILERKPAATLLRAPIPMPPKGSPTASIVMDAASAESAPLVTPVRQETPRRGPGWFVAMFMSLVSAGLAFGAGLSIGRTTAPVPEPIVEVKEITKVVERPAPPPVELPRFSRAEAAFRYGRAAFDEGNLEAAEDALSQALALNPVHAEATYLLARAKLALQKPAEARELFLQYKMFRPKAPEVEQIDELLRSGL